MAADKQVKLNLQLTAQDNASKVFDKFVQSMMKTAEKTSQIMAKMLDAEKLEKTAGVMSQAVQKQLNTINTKKAQQELKNLENSLKEESRYLKEMNLSIHAANAQMLGQSLLGAGMQAVHFFASAVEKAAVFDQSIVNAKASLLALGETQQKNGQYWDQLKDKAIEFGLKGYYSSAQVSEAMNTLARQGIHSSEIIQGGIQTVHDVAAANQQDLNETANVVSDIYHHFEDQLTKKFKGNVSAAFQEIGDAMSGALHRARLSMTDYLNTLKYVGPIASKVGWDLRDTSTGIAVLAENGIRGSQAGTSLRRMLTNIIPTTKEAKAAFHTLGIDTGKYGSALVTTDGHAKKFADIASILHERLAKLPPVQQEMAVKALFGQYALGAMMAVADKTHQSLADLMGTMAKQGLTTDMLNEKNDGLEVQLNRLKSDWDTLSASIGEAIKPVVKFIADAIEPLVTWFVKLPDPVKQVIVGVTTLGALILTLGGFVLTVVGGFGMFVGGLAEIGIGIGTVMGLTSGFVLALAGIVGAVVAVKHAWDANLGGIQQKAKEVWDWIVKNWDDSMKTINDAMKPLRKDWDDLMKDIDDATGTMVNDLYNWWKKMKPDAEKAFKETSKVIADKLNEIHQWWKDHKDKIEKTAGEIWDAIKKGAAKLQEWWQKDLKPTINDIVSTLQDKADQLQHIFGPFADKVSKDVQKIQDWFAKLKKDKDFQTWAAWIQEALSRTQYVWDTTWGTMTNGLNTAWNLMKSYVKNGLDWIESQLKGWEDILIGSVDLAKDLFNGKWNKAWHDAERVVGGVGTLIIGDVNLVGSDITDTFTTLGEGAFGWAQNMMGNFISGLWSKLPDMKSVVHSITQFIHDNLAHNSPAKEGLLSKDDRWFPNMMKMFAQGIDEHRPLIENAIGKMALDIEARINPYSAHIGKASILDKLLGAKQVYSSQHQPLRIFTMQTPVADPFTQNAAQYALNRQGGQVTEVHIHIDGRTQQTDNELVDKMLNKLGSHFRTHLSLHTPL